MFCTTIPTCYLAITVTLGMHLGSPEGPAEIPSAINHFQDFVLDLKVENNLPRLHLLDQDITLGMLFGSRLGLLSIINPL